MDHNIKILKDKLRSYSTAGEVFNLKKVLHFYVIDVLGELAFSQTFGVQIADDESLVPPVKEHSLLSAATGAWPLMTKRLKRWLPLVPHEGLQKLFQGRQDCAKLAAKCVQTRLSALQNQTDDKDSSMGRKDILTNLILAKHPDTGERLTQIDLETEAFGFMCVVGSPRTCEIYLLTRSYIALPGRIRQVPQRRCYSITFYMHRRRWRSV